LILSLCFVYLPCNKLEVGWIAVLSQVVVVGNAPRICIDRATTIGFYLVVDRALTFGLELGNLQRHQTA
jgi:hypothetical protein